MLLWRKFELFIFSRYLNLNIIIYTKINDDDNYNTYFLNISKNDINNKFILIKFYHDNHYNLLQLKEKNINLKINNIKSIGCNNITIDYIHKNNISKIKTNDFVKIENKENFYNDIIYSHLYTKKNTYDNQIIWKNVYYPQKICDEEVKNTKDKKKQNFRLQAEKYRKI